MRFSYEITRPSTAFGLGFCFGPNSRNGWTLAIDILVLHLYITYWVVSNGKAQQEN